MKPATIRLALGILLAVSGCGPDPDTPLRVETMPHVPELGTGRITITRIGVIKDDLSYDGRRGVYVIVDTKTGKEFIGISGVGITETGAHLQNKTPVHDER
jgi:hypothetical protein